MQIMREDRLADVSGEWQPQPINRTGDGAYKVGRFHYDSTGKAMPGQGIAPPIIGVWEGRSFISRPFPR